MNLRCTASRLTLLLLSLTSALPVMAAESIVRLATTTSTDNSGLLAVLLPPFEQKSGHRVHVIAVGTGKALKLAERGDVDIIMVHAPDAEMAFVEAGLGVNRRSVMARFHWCRGIFGQQTVGMKNGRATSSRPNSPGGRATSRSSSSVSTRTTRPGPWPPRLLPREPPCSSP